MDKPWDGKALMDMLKAEGMPSLEIGAEKIAGALFMWLEKSIELEGGLVQALASPAVAAIKKAAMDQINKIDGQPG